MKTLIKTIAALAIILTAHVGAMAQDEEDHFDSSNKTYNNKTYKEGRYERKSRNMFSRRDFGLYLGLNTFDTDKMPELDNWKSRYVALSWKKNHRLITGNKVDVAMGTGFEFAWNNYMLKDNITLTNQGTAGADFVEVKSQLDKSKVVVTNFNVPLMLQFGFKESKWILGLGAYGGARIDSYTKVKGENGTKRDHGAFNMNKFHYGLAAELGHKNFTLFARYQMTPLFKDNNPVNGNSVMFGIRL